MSEATIIAIVFFLFLFLLMGIAVFKDSVKSGIEMMKAIGAVFGVLIGAIPGFYFGNQVSEKKVDAAVAEKDKAIVQKKAAVDAIAAKADDIDKQVVQPLNEILTNDQKSSKISPADRQNLTEQLDKAKESISDIKVIKDKVSDDVAVQPQPSGSDQPADQ